MDLMYQVLALFVCNRGIGSTELGCFRILFQTIGLVFTTMYIVGMEVGTGMEVGRSIRRH